jgi:hypothetical protein
MLNQTNIIVVVGDIGSGVNLIKNLLIVPENTVWLGPPTNDRVTAIINTVYPTLLKNDMTRWLDYEYLLRTWNKVLGVDIADSYADIDTVQVRQYSQHKKIVFVTHWPEIAANLKTMYPGITLISLYPNTINELAWQVKTYILKKSIETLQEFSFSTNTEKLDYINKFGTESYYQLNVLNMIEIMWNRHVGYKNLPGHNLKISDLWSNDSSWLTNLQQVNPELNIVKSSLIVNNWKQLHNWNQDIWDFKYFDLVKKSPLFSLVDQK